MAKLSYQERKKLPKKDFVEKKERGYPIEDRAHAINALARSSGKPESAEVRRAVYKKFPSLKKKNK